MKPLIKKCDIVSQVLKSLSHPVRLKLLCQLSEKECTVGELTEFCEISQSAMSQFLKRMKDEGILKQRKERTFIYYSIVDDKLIKLLHAIKEIYE
jgi:DNA-binding transcriptional ArsR family regulator